MDGLATAILVNAKIPAVTDKQTPIQKIKKDEYQRCNFKGN